MRVRPAIVFLVMLTISLTVYVTKLSLQIKKLKKRQHSIHRGAVRDAGGETHAQDKGGRYSHKNVKVHLSNKGANREDTATLLSPSLQTSDSKNQLEITGASSLTSRLPAAITTTSSLTKVAPAAFDDLEMRPLERNRPSSGCSSASACQR